jgi:hypothetical protein
MPHAIERDLARYEPFVRRYYAPTWMRDRLAVDHDDVRAECRVSAWRALVAARQLGLPPEEEIAYVRRSISSAFISLIRKANAKPRAALARSFDADLDTLSDAAPTAEHAVLAAERQAACQAAVERLRGVIGETIFQDLYEIHAVGSRGTPTAPRRSTKGSRLAAVRRARREMPGATIADVVHLYGDAAMPDSRPVETLPVAELARVALANRSPVKALDRPYLVREVSAIMTDDRGDVQDFPPCFASPRHFDLTDPTCTKECGFCGDCEAALGARPEIEAQLATIQRAHAPAPRSPPLVLIKSTTTPPPPPPLVEEDDTEEDAPTEVPSIPDEDHDEEAPAIPGDDEEDEIPSAPDEDPVEDAKPAAPPRPKRRPKVRRPGPSTPTGGSKRLFRAQPIAPERVYLSQRRGVLPAGQKAYALKADGSRWYRKPQGSAAELALLPVGHELERDWRGVRYRVVKLKDGRGDMTRATGATYRRDGVWRVLWTAQIDERGQVVGSPQESMIEDGTLGQLARSITGNNAWSGAKFFAVLSVHVHIDRQRRPRPEIQSPAATLAKSAKPRRKPKRSKKRRQRKKS